MRRLFVALVIVVSTLLACSGARFPSAADGAAGVELAAKAIRMTADTCLRATDGLMAANLPGEAADLSDACLAVLEPALDRVNDAADLVDTGKAVEAGDWVCVVVRTAHDLGKLAPALGKVGYDMPPAAVRLSEFAGLFAGMCK